MLFTQFPAELLVEICTRLHSLREVRHLGLSCKPFYIVLLSLGYQHLCRLLSQLEHEAPTVANISREVMVAKAYNWATNLIAQSVADELDETPYYIRKSKRPRKDLDIIEGCGIKLAKEIFTTYLAKGGAFRARLRLKRVSEWLDNQLWDDRLTTISTCLTLQLAQKWKAEQAYRMLSQLCSCLEKHGKSYDLHETAEMVRAALYVGGVAPINNDYRRRIRELQLVWSASETIET